MDCPKKKPKLAKEKIVFDDVNLEGTTQLHDDALLVTLRIVGFLVERVMIDQGSRAKIMYSDLYNGLGIKVDNFTKYDTPLVGFDGKMVMLDGHITLLMVIKGKKVMMNFIVVNAFTPYMVILVRPWIHAMCVVPSTLHAKVIFPIE